jgi:hypothetical protein
MGRVAAMRTVITKFFADRLVTLVDPVADQQLRIGVVEQHREVRAEDLMGRAATLPASVRPSELPVSPGRLD